MSLIAVVKERESGARAQGPRFAVYVHGYNLPIRDVDGAWTLGGLYVWQVVEACDVDTAIAAAIEVVRTGDVYRTEIVDQVDIVPVFEAIEVRKMRLDDSRTGTAPIFYIDTDDPT